MRRLATHDFEWILPGHGRRCHFERDFAHGFDDRVHLVAQCGAQRLSELPRVVGVSH